MASATAEDASTAATGGGGYVSMFLSPLRRRWVRIFLIFEVVLVIGGFLIDALWGAPTGFGQHPQFFMAIGVVFAAIAIFLACVFLAIYALLVFLEFRARGHRSVEF